jgi:hypothetical protein
MARGVKMGGKTNGWGVADSGECEPWDPERHGRHSGVGRLVFPWFGNDDTPADPVVMVVMIVIPTPAQTGTTGNIWLERCWRRPEVGRRKHIDSL